jgi:hypothetical protein
MRAQPFSEPLGGKLPSRHLPIRDDWNRTQFVAVQIPHVCRRQDAGHVGQRGDTPGELIEPFE